MLQLILTCLLLSSYLFVSIFTKFLLALLVGVFVIKVLSVVLILRIVVFRRFITIIVPFSLVLARFVIINYLQVLKVVIHGSAILILVLILSFHVIVYGPNFCLIILDAIGKHLMKSS